MSRTGKKTTVTDTIFSISLEGADFVPLFMKKNNTLIGNRIMSPPYDSLGNSLLNSYRLRSRDEVGQIDPETGEQITFHQMRKKSVRLVYLPLLAGIYLSSLVNIWDAEYLNTPVRTIYFLLENNPDVIFVDEEDSVQLDCIIALINARGREFSVRIITLDKQGGRQTLDSILDGVFDDPILKNAFDDSVVDKFACNRNKGTDAAVLIYSCNASGYSGHARIPYQAFLSPSNDQTPVMKHGDVGLWYGRTTWTHNLLLTIRAILTGVTVIKLRHYSEENLCQIVEKYKVKWVFLESNMFNKLSNINNFQAFKKYNVSSLQTVLFGDADIKSDLYMGLIRDLPNASIIKVYALSETGVIAHQRSTSIKQSIIFSSGYVSQNVELMIVSLLTKDQLPKNVAGEIWCKTPCIIQTSNSAIWMRSKKDKKRINEGWYNTEDIGYFDENGEIYVIGNSRDVVKFRHVILSLTKIEETLLLHPDVSEAGAVGVRVYGKDINQVKAYVVKRPGAQVTETELAQFVKNNLMHDEYMLHRGVHFVNEIPYLPNGKVDRVKILTTAICT